MKITTQQIIDQFKRVEREQAKLKTIVLDFLILNHKENDGESISDIRQMDSMQMVEEILKQPKLKRNTKEFVSGLRDGLSQYHRLTESQRFHLESTYNQIFGE